VGLKLNGTCKLLADYTLLYYTILYYTILYYTINKNTETLINSTKAVGLEVNAEKTKYMLVSRDQNAGQTREI
jgi:hypothetical protein